MQPAFPDPVLSPAIDAALDRIADQRGTAADIRLVTAGLGALPLRLYDRAARELGWRLGRLGEAPAWRAGFVFRAFWRRPAAVPAWLRLFDRSGYVREAALKKLRGPAPNAFFVAALAYRLNDWVPQVRAAAAEALAADEPPYRPRDPRPGHALPVAPQPGLGALGRRADAAR